MSNLFNTEANTNVRRPKRILSWLIPILLIIVMAVLFLASGWRNLLPQKEVDAARARIGDANVAAKEGETLFQAAGWVQPAPYAISVTALVSGVVKKIHAIDGDEVKKGQLLVELIDDDIQLQLANENARLEELIIDKKEKELMVEIKKAQLANIDSLEETAHTVAKRIKHKADSFRSAKDALPIFETEQAELKYSEQLKRIDEFSSRKKILSKEIELAENSIAVTEAMINTQKTVIDKVKLDLSRTKIYAPAKGLIQEMLAREGRKQMLGSDNEKSTTVATLFNTEKIQVLVDVPLIDVPKVKIKQKTLIYTEVLSDPINGIVTAVHGHADYQKNTLRVYVAIPGGHPDLRPEMIAQVKFLSDAPDKKKIQEKTSGVFIKKEAIFGDGQVWTIDSEMKVSKKQISLGKAEKDGWVQVISGINAGEKVIVAPPTDMKEGRTVKLGKLYE